ncbi:ribosomal L32p family protein [Sodiomyces alkalinus F11]|uniref:Large ribosomal subunit protein bL32m n=1 Tax=Sodiomyces alkalinus (strain CBS 110278 / VKM F-3762 / F11) TaxID=1314773 RepID=A0A3N2Q6J1_SODAK|nr:ribosomal L32p family protein [Sodiomyces alkalinus F11]ROT42360.1 ribosomal L32p family protein [Sodiomyces alkalinus F11]
MASAAIVAQPLRLPSLLPRLSLPTLLQAPSAWSHSLRQFTHPLLPRLAIVIPAVQLNIPAWLGDIWESILRAVPKKKTTHSKKRSRLMAGKALKDVTSLCKCPGCGQVKRQHVLCPHCMEQIKTMWRSENPSGKFV